jgi:hypothetical protein
MIRVYCKTPSTGKFINYFNNNIAASSTTWTTIAEAPDFSVPDARRLYKDRDPTNTAARGIRAGEIFFMTPVFVKNTTLQTLATIQVRILPEGTYADATAENLAAIGCPGIMTIPGNDTGMVPVQGRSLFKRNYLSANGDRLQIKSDVAIQLWATGEEKASSEHIYET